MKIWSYIETFSLFCWIDVCDWCDFVQLQSFAFAFSLLAAWKMTNCGLWSVRLYLWRLLLSSCSQTMKALWAVTHPPIRWDVVESWKKPNKKKLWLHLFYFTIQDLCWRTPTVRWPFTLFSCDKVMLQRKTNMTSCCLDRLENDIWSVPSHFC